jgi:hypothetical protein
VFEPVPLSHALAELDVRGLLHDKPVDYGMQPGTPPDSPAWTTVKLTTLSDRGLELDIRLVERSEGSSSTP